MLEFAVEYKKTKNIIEGALLAAARSLNLNQLEELFNGPDDNERPTRDQIRQVLQELEQDYNGRGMELKQVGGGFRIQVRQDYQHWISRLWEEKPPRYSRALLETMAIIAYRQPVTRGEIEDIRGVSVSANITKTLQEREWIRVVGHRDVPGKPAMFGTTKEFLDYFNLKSLDELPTLAQLRDLDSIYPELDLEGHAQNSPTTSDSDENNKSDVLLQVKGEEEAGSDSVENISVKTEAPPERLH